jgi:phenylacetate-CoA oxygenase PaaJ subunit
MDDTATDHDATTDREGIDGDAPRGDDGDTGAESAGAGPPDAGPTDTGPTYCAHTDYAQDGPAVEELPATGEGAEGVERRVWDALYGIEDPEMPISIADLGLLYGVSVAGGHAIVDMTLTYTGCPARKMLTEEVENVVGAVAGVESVDLRLVWSPPWSLEMVTDQGRADLREFGLSVPDADEGSGSGGTARTEVQP